MRLHVATSCRGMNFSVGTEMRRIWSAVGSLRAVCGGRATRLGGVRFCGEGADVFAALLLLLLLLLLLFLLPFFFALLEVLLLLLFFLLLLLGVLFLGVVKTKGGIGGSVWLRFSGGL